MVRVGANQHENQARLRYLIDTATTPLPGAASLLTHLPSQARPLAAPTLKVVRLEALRELKASSQRVGIHHAEETGFALQAANGTALTSPVMQYVQVAIMTRPAAIAEQAMLDELKNTYPFITRSAKPHLTDKSSFQRFTQAIQLAVKLYHPQLAAQQQLGPTPPLVALASTASPATTPQKVPGPKRRRPKL